MTKKIYCIVVIDWHDINVQMTNGAAELIELIEKVIPGVWIIKGLSDAGMTLAFGLAVEWAESL